MFQFSIKQMLFLVALFASLIGLFPTYLQILMSVIFVADHFLGRGSYAFFSANLLLAIMTWFALRNRPRLSGYLFILTTIVMHAGTAVVCVYLYSIGGWILMSLIIYLLIPFTLLCGNVWASRSIHPSKTVAMMTVFTLSLVPLLIPATHWPLRLAAVISRPWMDRMADRIASGEKLSSPEWAGLYRIVGVERQPENGNIALLIDADPSGRSAFVRYHGSTETFGPLINLNFNLPMGGPWFYQDED